MNIVNISFTDMGTLVLEALSKMDHLPVARVHIPGIARLSLHHSISGLYTLVSPTTEKLGELQVHNIIQIIQFLWNS